MRKIHHIRHFVPKEKWPENVEILSYSVSGTDIPEFSKFYMAISVFEKMAVSEITDGANIYIEETETNWIHGRMYSLFVNSLFTGIPFIAEYSHETGNGSKITLWTAYINPNTPFPSPDLPTT